MCKDVYRSPETKPYFQHFECSTCRYLGSATIKGEHYDYYYCPQGSCPTILSRFGDEGSQYHSGLDLYAEEYVTLDYAAQGIYLAMAAGLIPRKPVGILMGIAQIPEPAPRAKGMGISQMILHQDSNGSPLSVDIVLDRPDANGHYRTYRLQADFK